MKSEKILLIIAIIFIIVGTGIFLYPSISNYFAEKNHVEAIRNYDKMVVKIGEDSLKKEKEKAQTYNENLSGDPVHDPFVLGSGYALPENYKEVLNLSEDGIMGYIQIPKISVDLPIYHGTSEEVLEKGVGHIQNTSVPIGGSSTHSVLTGHTGLPNAELFTRLDELVVGDVFYIHILNERLAYKVYEIKVVLPDNIDELRITSGEDLVTLVTCTPYGVNSHRLLVKAERVEDYIENNGNTTEASNNSNTINNVETKKNNKQYYLTGIQIGTVILIIVIITTLIVEIIIKRSKKSDE